MKRRSFFKALLCGLAGAATIPWLSRLFGKKDDSLWIPDWCSVPDELFEYGKEGTWTLEFWFRRPGDWPAEESWQHFAQTHDGSKATYYLDGMKGKRPPESIRKQIEQVDYLRISSIVLYTEDFDPPTKMTRPLEGVELYTLGPVEKLVDRALQKEET
jgi:hypothetical protein